MEILCTGTSWTNTDNYLAAIFRANRTHTRKCSLNRGWCTCVCDRTSVWKLTTQMVDDFMSVGRRPVNHFAVIGTCKCAKLEVRCCKVSFMHSMLSCSVLCERTSFVVAIFVQLQLERVLLTPEAQLFTVASCVLRSPQAICKKSGPPLYHVVNSTTSTHSPYVASLC